MSAISLLHQNDFWIMMAGIAPAILLITGSIRAIHNYFRRNRIDRLEMYVQLVDDLQAELIRLRSDLRDEREAHSKRVQELSSILESQVQENIALRSVISDRSKNTSKEA